MARVSKVRIKICGVTRPMDAAMAAQAGADAIGMVMYPPARRCISKAVAEQIIAALPPLVEPVLLFVNQDTDEIERIADEVGVKTIQLHGEEPPEAMRRLKRFRLLKAVRCRRETLEQELLRWRRAIKEFELGHLRGLVLEADAAGPGGAGVENDFELLESMRRRGAFDGLPPIILAGGLRPETVAGAIERVRPFAVDVSSGVEAAYGEKSAEKAAAFVKAARSVELGI